MESHEALKRAFERTCLKEIAAELGVSHSLVCKWAQEQSEGGNGSRNPLDRLLEIYRLTGDLLIVEWLCHQCGGYFVRSPEKSIHDGIDLLPPASVIIDQFSHLLHRISRAAADASITADEAGKIREQWNNLKSIAEGFVRCCEEGDFEAIPKEGPPAPETKKTLY
jgi:transcriptional regulator with XRE-family HTH domain